MANNNSRERDSFISKYRKMKLWKKVVSVLSCIVVFCTTYALILPAITVEKNAYCGMEEHPEHSIEAGCFKEVQTLICEQEETEGHTHNEACYQTNQNLICALELNEEHPEHTEECYAEETVLVCEQPEMPAHVHGEECYKISQELICEKPVHSHTKDCYKTEETAPAPAEQNAQAPTAAPEEISDPKADVESRADWEKTVEDVELTGVWGVDVMSIAESQLGYTESSRNFIYEDGEKKGYTRYGHWYGNEYGDWCAMFVSFCLNYAGVDKEVMPFEASCRRWINKYNEDETINYHTDDNYVPLPGDLIFFDWDKFDKKEDRVADHVGLVAEVLKDENGKIEKVKTIEGNYSTQVEYRTYLINDISILGYGELPVNPEKEKEITEKTFEGKDYIVTATYTGNANIPEDATLEAPEYAKNSENYKARYAEAKALYGWADDEDHTEDFRLFNIGFWQKSGLLGLGKEEIEPRKEVQVSITYKDVEKAKECKVAHFGDTPEVLEAEASSESGEAVVSFTADSFSDYGLMLLADDDLDLVMPLAAADEEANLIAYFPFIKGSQNAMADSQGNATMKEPDQPIRHIGYGTYTIAPGSDMSLNMSYSKKEDNKYKSYATITAKNGSALLTGYDEISLDFWMYTKQKTSVVENGEETANGDTTNGWPFTIRNGDNYLGVYVNNNGTIIQAEKGAGAADSASINGQNLNGKWVHVRADYTNTEVKLTLWDANGDQIGTKTTSNTRDIEALLGNSSTFTIGYNSKWNEYYNGLIDELKIYAKKTSAEPESAHHVHSGDEIVHVSFDGREGDNNWWRDDTTDDIGNARFETRTSSNNNNALAEGAANVAPVKTVQESAHPCSAKIVPDEQDYITIAGNSGTVIKNNHNDAFAFDFWVKPNANTDNSEYGLFRIGSSQSGQHSRFLTATIPSNNNALNRIDLEVEGFAERKWITIALEEDITNQWAHVCVSYEGNVATLWVENEEGRVLGQGSILNAYAISSLFERTNEVLEFGRSGDSKYFNGFVDEIIFYDQAKQVPTNVNPGDPNHPKTAITETINATGVGLYNINTKGGAASPLAGVEYSVYDSAGNLYGTFVTSNQYVLLLGKIPAGTYTIEQTAVPAGYAVVPQRKTFTVSANADNLTQAGIFYDYYDEESYNPDKVAEFYDYANRIYDIKLSAQSGRISHVVDPKNFNFVVDQSNSMLFPAVLYDTGQKVLLHSVNDSDSSTTNDASGNSSRLDKVMNDSGLDPNGLYYIKALDETKATVYAIWKSANGHWYAQDAAYYAQAQMGVHHVSEARNYKYSDDSSNDNNTYVIDGGGCLDGINRAAHDASKGYSINGMSDLWDDIQKFGQINEAVSNRAGTDHSKEYIIYTGSEMNRLTYLKYAIKRMIYQLAAMDSKNRVTITGFDRYIEGCITREVYAGNPQGIIDLINFVDGIQTAGGTAQNYGIAHVLGDHATGGNHSDCQGNHLNYTADGIHASDYIVLITDGALNNSNKPDKSDAAYRVYSSSDAGANEEEKQALDLYAGAQKFMEKAYDPVLITIGLSVHDVTWAQTLLADQAHNGIASNGFSYLDINADQLSVTLSNALINDLIRLKKEDDYADIKDYISDSFYVVAPNGEVLNDGQWLTLDGQKTTENAANAAGQLKHDDIGWYVEWKNQLLEINGTVKHYTYTDDNQKSTVLDTSTIYYIDYDAGRSISATGPWDSTRDKLVFKNGQWIYEWRDMGGETNRRGDVGNKVQSTDYTAAPWEGKIYVKAKEDFIGGNTIDTNKGDATIALIRGDGYDEDLIPLPTPTVNVRLLPINEFTSEETLFLSDTVSDIETKIKALEEQIYFRKIVTSTAAVQDKETPKPTPTNDAYNDGLYGGRFYLDYALGRELTQDEWDELLAGETIRIPYTYDDASSHGAVGEFVITLTKEGATTCDDHPTTQTGLDVEKYTFKVEYKAYRITGDGATRPADVHNYGNGPGTEVGSDDNAHNTVQTGLGHLTSNNTHEVHVVDGEMTVRKKIDNTLKAAVDKNYEFELFKKNDENEFEKYGDITVTVKANELSGEYTLQHLPRGEYQLKEKESDDYIVQSVNTYEANCENETISTTEIDFTIGHDTAKNDVIIHEPHKVNNTEVYSYETDGTKVYSYLSGKSYKPANDLDCQGVSFERAEITNTKKEMKIPVKKVWDEHISASDYANRNVYVALYKTENGTETPVGSTDGKIHVLKLNAANDWSGEFTVPATAEKDLSKLGYFVKELSGTTTTDMDENTNYKGAIVTNGGENEKVWYKDAISEGLVEIDGKYFTMKFAITLGTEDSGQELQVTNSPTYSLPESGGIGTNKFTIGGLLLISISLLFGFLLRRKQERRIN